MTRKIGPQFDCNDVTRTDSHVIYGVWANGKAPLNGGGAPGTFLGAYIGRVWQQDSYGWVAAPPKSLWGRGTEPDSWSEEVNRSVRHFARRKDACLYLWGFAQGTARATPAPRNAREGEE